MNESTRMIALVAVVLAIVGVLAWALTRQVEPAPVPVADTIPSSPPPASPTTFGDTAGTNPFPTQTSPAMAPATGSAPPPPPSEHANDPEKAAVPRMAASQLRGMVERNEVVVVDVRDTMSYQTAHIPGALHIPFALVEGDLGKLPKDKPIVTYCT